MSTPKAMTLALLLMFSSSVVAQDTDSPAIEEFTSLGAKIGVRVFFPSHNND